MILITGANGQLGTELRHLLDERNEEYVAVDVAEMDITNGEKVDEVFAQVKPTLVYHCAAYTAVDAAEDEGKELDYAINVTGTENVAKASEKHGATLVYISTDYVFDGNKPVAIMVIREFLLSSSCSLEETVPHMILASVPTIS